MSNTINAPHKKSTKDTFVTSSHARKIQVISSKHPSSSIKKHHLGAIRVSPDPISKRGIRIRPENPFAK